MKKWRAKSAVSYNELIRLTRLFLFMLALGLGVGGSPVEAQVAVKNSATTYFSSATTNMTFSDFTVADGLNRKLVVSFNSEDADSVTGVTYGGVALTKAVDSGTTRIAEIWYLDDPAVGSADVVLEWSGNGGRARVGVLSLQHATPGVSVTALANASTSIQITTTVSNSFLVGNYTINNGTAIGSPLPYDTQLYVGDSGSSTSHSGYSLEGAPGLKTYTYPTTAAASLVVAAFGSEAAPPAVDFGGDYTSANQNTLSGDPDPLIEETGNVDFNGGNDRRAYRTIDSLFGEINNPNGLTNKVRRIFAGLQIANLENTTDDPTFGLFRFNDGSTDRIQVTSGAGTMNMAMAFAPYVTKTNFVNGYDSELHALSFSEASDSIAIHFAQVSSGGVFRALVKNGQQWYVSASSASSASVLTLNGLTETWHPYDPSGNLFIDEANLPAGIPGSSFTDIQAIGAFVQSLSFDGSNAHAFNVQVEAITAQLDQVVLTDTVGDRLLAMIQDNIDNPWPGISNPNDAPGVFSYALACLYMNQNVSQANTLLFDFYTNNPVQPNPGATLEDWNGYFWQHMVWRLFMDPVMNARLTTQTRELIEDNLWTWVDTRSKISDAQGSVWIIHDSENHDAMQKGSHLMSLVALKNSSRYGPDVVLANGGTIAEHLDAWTEYYLRYFRARAQEGINVEIASPIYAKYSMGAYYNIMDFAESAELRDTAKAFIDLYWADTASDWVSSGVRGGGEARCYKESYLRNGTSYSFIHLLYGYGWHGGVGTVRTYPLILATSSYRIPDIITACSTDPNRPPYLYSSRRFGRGWEGTSDYTVVFDNGDSNVRRDTYVTPDYSMGTFTVDMNRDYIKLLDQNRAMGVMFASGINDRIMAFGKGASSNDKSYADLNGVTREDCMVVQRDKNAYDAGNATHIYISPNAWANRVETNGWFFTQLGDAYCALKPAGGGYTTAVAGSGMDLILGDLWAPVVIQTGQAGDYTDFSDFQNSVTTNVFTYSAGTMNYTSEAGETFTFYANSKTTPKVNGTTVNLNPAKTYDSPYLSMTHGEESAAFSYTGYSDLKLDFGSVPTISSLTPADDSGNVPFNAKLIATFSEAVQAGTGFITIRKVSDDSVFEAVDVTDTNRVSFSGSQLTVTPGSNFAADTAYYVTIVASAVEDLSGNAFAGLSGNAAWNFTTAPAATIVTVNTGSKVVASSLGNSSTTFSFDAGASADMLIVALSSEKDGGSYSVTYNGHPLTEAVLGGQADIWYLDLTTNSYAGGNADLVVDYTGITTVNGVGIGAVSVSASGESIQLHTAASSASGTSAVGLTTTENKTFVAACFNANSSGTPVVDAPLTTIYASGNIGSAQGAAGYENDVAAGTHTYSWTVSNARKVVAASFVIDNQGGTNAPPVADSQNTSVAEDSSVAITLTGSDPDGDPLTYAIATGPANGSLSGTAPNVTYTPALNYNGADSFTFTVSDGVVTSAAATVSITVNAVNDAPVANAQSTSVSEDGSIAVTLTGSDADGDALSYIVETGPANGSLSGAAPNLTYTPALNYNGADSFTFTVSDGVVTSSAATVSITVVPVNDAPVAHGQSTSVDEDGSVAITLTGSDVDGDPLTYAIGTGPANGSLSGTAPNVTYTPDPSYNGTDSFTFTVSDSAITSAAATVSITVNAAPSSGPDVRVTEYYLTTGDFSGTTATVTLDQDLADDYYILVRGSRTGDGTSKPNNDYARILSVPGGKGELADSGGADQIGLQRQAADFDWEGVVTVVECGNVASPAGFRLVDIVDTSLTGTSGTDTSGAWSDLDQVVLFGGYRGGGIEMFGTPANRKQGTGCYTRLYPSGTNTLNWSRDAGGETMFDAAMTTFVVEWGSEWGVQHVNVAGNSGGNGADATGEYTTTAISSVARSSSWVWGTGTRSDSGIGDCAESCLITLGDGVNQNASETTVAVGSEYTDAYTFDVYVLTHPDIAVDYRFKVDGDSTGLDVPVAVDTAATGARFSLGYNGCNGTGAAFPRPRMWARYTTDSEVTVSRGYDGQNFPVWVQGIDLSGLND